MTRENFNLPERLAQRLADEAETRQATKTAVLAGALDLLFTAIDSGSAQPLAEGAPPAENHELIVALNSLGLSVRMLAQGELGEETTS